MGSLRDVLVPDIGDFKNIPVIEVLVKPGDSVKAEDSLITLESDKATMEVPAPFAGVVKELKIKTGDKVSEGAAILSLEVSEAGAAQPSTAPAAPQKPAPAPAPVAPTQMAPPASLAPPTSQLQAAAAPATINEEGFSRAHASPSVRRFARELGVDLGRVKGSGPKERILKEDVAGFVKSALAQTSAGGGGGPSLQLGLPAWPQVDFAKFGPVENLALSRIRKISGPALHRNWVSIPHVTQNDEADITELEAFRKSMADEAQKQGVKLTPLVFIMKAVVAALKNHPEFNASLAPSGDALIVKRYYHIGVAVDTPGGLVVPVVRNVDQKGILQLAKELAETSTKAREGKLGPADMQGGTFSISSLGGIGGSHFTPIINAPEIAILGVSKSAMKPVWKDGQFVPRLIIPLSLSYDHRAVDGAQGARFITNLTTILSDLRRVLL
ncbi:MAG TPA: dihydrolipoyllysine-residue acetyltransferase [Burkholderiales bacterium]|nr:dihydrolipoyllysine-residue acetyltransferase [Burkholderiales bacterium]